MPSIAVIGCRPLLAGAKEDEAMSPGSGVAFQEMTRFGVLVADDAANLDLAKIAPQFFTVLLDEGDPSRREAGYP